MILPAYELDAAVVMVHDIRDKSRSRVLQDAYGTAGNQQTEGVAVTDLGSYIRTVQVNGVGLVVYPFVIHTRELVFTVLVHEVHFDGDSNPLRVEREAAVDLVAGDTLGSILEGPFDDELLGIREPSAERVSLVHGGARCLDGHSVPGGGDVQLGGGSVHVVEGHHVGVPGVQRQVLHQGCTEVEQVEELGIRVPSHEILVGGGTVGPVDDAAVRELVYGIGGPAGHRFLIVVETDGDLRPLPDGQVDPDLLPVPVLIQSQQDQGHVLLPYHGMAVKGESQRGKVTS